MCGRENEDGEEESGGKRREEEEEEESSVLNVGIRERVNKGRRDGRRGR